MTSTLDDWHIGNLLGDLIHKRRSYLLPISIQKGVKIHYNIDAYTDNHSLVTEGTKLLHQTQGKYAPVCTDLIWDLCLSENWSAYSSTAIDDYIQNVNDLLLSKNAYYEPKLQDKIAYLVSKNFLKSYTSVDTMQVICEKIHARTKFESNLPTLMEDYTKHHLAFNELFEGYFPQIQARIEAWKAEIAIQFSKLDEL